MNHNFRDCALVQVYRLAGSSGIATCLGYLRCNGCVLFCPVKKGPPAPERQPVSVKG